jgi:hypothetical protein
MTTPILTMPEDDPDTLQLLDELDKDWVKRWRKATKQEAESNDITYVVPPMNEPKQKSK